NDLYTEEQGKRLFPIVGIGSSLGALAGSQIASVFFGDLGVERLFLVAGGLIAGSLFLTWRGNQQACRASAMKGENNASSIGSRGAFSIISWDRFLRLIALMVVLLNIVNTGGEYLLSKLVVAEAARAAVGAADPILAKQAFIGHFY